MSGYVAADSWTKIEQLGITHILSIMPGARDKFAQKGIKYLLLTDIKDNDEQDILQYFEQSNDFIQNAITENDTNKILVHCAAGASRSGAFCCAYLIVECGMTFDQAIA